MQTPSLYNDRQLFLQIAHGNESAFRELFIQQKERLYRLAIKMLHDPPLAEEVVQEVFLSLWTSRDKLPAVENPAAYLFTMTANRVTTELRKIASDQKMRNALKSRLATGGNTTLEMVDAREKEALVRQAINAMPPQRQLVYKLSRLDGLSYEEIAEKLGISRNTVRNHLAEALKTIRAFLNRSALGFALLVKTITNFF